MSYMFAVRGWLELSWPDEEVEGVDESAEEHAAKIQRIKDYCQVTLTLEELLDEEQPERERFKAGWSLPAHDLNGTEYLFYGADVDNAGEVLEMIKEILSIDPFADGYFSVEGEDGLQYRQWMVMGGRIFTRRHLFPDFDRDRPPEGYSLRFSAHAPIQ